MLPLGRFRVVQNFRFPCYRSTFLILHRAHESIKVLQQETPGNFFRNSSSVANMHDILAKKIFLAKKSVAVGDRKT